MSLHDICQPRHSGWNLRTLVARPGSGDCRQHQGERWDWLFEIALRHRQRLQKRAAWLQLYWPVRQLPQKQQRVWIKEFCETNRVDLGAICRAEAMTWNELREISKDPLCTIGAHTVNHYAVAQVE